MLQLAFAASYYNPRNHHWEPLLEPWVINVRLLYKSAAALCRRIDDGGDYFGAEVGCTPLLLNATHAFLDSLVTSLTSEYLDSRSNGVLRTLDPTTSG